jgi:hypothetical protein
MILWSIVGASGKHQLAPNDRELSKKITARL